MKPEALMLSTSMVAITQVLNICCLVGMVAAVPNGRMQEQSPFPLGARLVYTYLGDSDLVAKRNQGILVSHPSTSLSTE
jgi:hypothetical protein